MRKFPWFLPALFLLATSAVFGSDQPKSLFYLTRDPNSARDFLAHADKIDLLVPTWYSVNADGLVSGGPNSEVLAAAREHHVAVMPIIVDGGFVQEDFHKFLGNPTAHKEMIEALIRECKANGYIGIQFDFENVLWTDRDALSALVAETATALHHENLQLSIATVPNAPGKPGERGFSAWIYANWRGAYDLKALAQSADLICLMTYDQNTLWTEPGPVAGWKWVMENLDYALRFVPKEKLSLGIPLYGYHWYAGTPTKIQDKTTGQLKDKPNPTGKYISYQDATDLARAYGGKIEWDAGDRTSWTYFYRDDMREWIFFTDERTFRERYELVKKQGLQGFCSWVLGTEDPKIWDLLPTHK